MHFTRANSCRTLLRSILDRSLISMANYYLTLKFKIRWLKSSIFIEYVRLPEYQNKNPQSTGEILFLLFKTRLHRKLLPKYVIVLQVAAKKHIFYNIIQFEFFLGSGQYSPCHTQPKTSQTCCKLSILPHVATCQQIATSLSISPSCNISVKIRLIAICHLQTCYNLLKQLATSLLK